MAHALLDPALQLYVSNRLREKDGQTIEELAKHFRTSEANVHRVLGLLRKEGQVVPFKTKWYLKQRR
jgi:DNA-binding IclR family transcriptional regulator